MNRVAPLAQAGDRDNVVAGIGSSIPFGNVRHEIFDLVHWLSLESARVRVSPL